eukprot:749047-Prymnesium_polylepis.1
MAIDRPHVGRGHELARAVAGKEEGELHLSVALRRREEQRAIGIVGVVEGAAGEERLRPRRRATVRCRVPREAQRERRDPAARALHVERARAVGAREQRQRLRRGREPPAHPPPEG